MSSYRVIGHVSQALRTVLWQSISSEPELNAIVTTEEQIVFKNPEQSNSDSANRLSLWLYQVTENEFVKNQPMLQVNGNGRSTTQFPPLAINLFYLLTPTAVSIEADHLLLGRAMQTFYDQAIVYLHEPVEDIYEELRIIFCRVSLEELTRVWDALRQPYRLSVCYQVRVSHIDSVRLPEGARIIERAADFDDEPAKAAARL